MWVKYDALLGKLRTKDWSSSVVLSTWVVSPVWVVTPAKAWDEYLDTVTWLKYFNSDWTVNGWKEYSYTQDL